jgi:hypothetical protein
MRDGLDEDEKKAVLQTRRELAKALRLSVDGVIHDPLPQRMIVLLLRLAFAQTMRATFSKTRKKRLRQSEDHTDVRV